MNLISRQILYIDKEILSLHLSSRSPFLVGGTRCEEAPVEIMHDLDEALAIATERHLLE